VPGDPTIIKDDWIVGRQSETSIFYENMMASDPEYAVFVITGLRGFGKTTLLSRFGELGKEGGCLVGSCDSETDPIHAISVLIKQFSDQGHPVKELGKKYDTCQK